MEIKKLKAFFLTTPKNIKEFMTDQFAKPEGLAGDFFALAMNVFNFKLYNCVYNYVGKQQGARILDVGFGNGDMLKRLDKKIQDVKFYGVDISDNMVVVATSANQEAVDRNRMSLENAPVEALPYEDGCFDTVYTINTIYFWQDLDRALREIVRVLKPGARFICGFYCREYFEKNKHLMNKDQQHYSARELKDLVSQYGFENIRVKVVDEKKFMYCLVCEKRGESIDTDNADG